MLGARSNNHILDRKGPLKVIAIITLWSFLFTTLGDGVVLLEDAWAARTPLGLASTGLNRPGSPSASHKELDVESFTLPDSLGYVKDSWKGDSGKTVVHIQDAHCNYSCQKSIQSIVDYLTGEYGIDLALLEGGAGNYDLSIFTDIEDRFLREKVADSFVKEGRVNGAEFFAINNPDRITLKGLEEPALYIKNLKAYRKSLAYKNEVDKILKVLEHYLSNLKRHIYSGELKEFEEKRKAYNDKKTELGEYLTYLAKLSEKLGIDISRNKNLNSLIKTIEHEKDIDFRRANSERERLIEELTKRISSLELETLVEKSLQFKEGNIKPTEFYSYLFRKARTIDLDICTSYPTLSCYKEYIDRYESVDNWILFNEIESLEAGMIERLCTTNTQKRLYELSKNLLLQKDLFNVSLTVNRYRYLREDSRSLDISHFVSFITTEAPKYKINLNISDDIEILDRYRESMEQFYEFAYERDNAFLRKIVFHSQDRERLIVVSGGFHSENLQRLLKDRGYSYVSILPKFVNNDNYECPYFDLLAGRETKLDELIDTAISYTTDNSSIAINSLFSEMGISDITDVRERSRISLKSQLLQAVLIGRPFTINTIWGWDIVISSQEDPQGANRVFKADTEGLELTAAIYKGRRHGAADIVLVDGDTMTVKQHDLWIDELGEEIGYHLFGERKNDGENIEGLFGALRDTCGLEPHRIEFIRENIAENGACELRVWNDKERPMPVAGHPGADAIYLSCHTLKQGIDHAAVQFLHELGGAYKQGETRRKHTQNDELNKAHQAGEPERLQFLARGVLDFAMSGARIGQGEDRDLAMDYDDQYAPDTPEEVIRCIKRMCMVSEDHPTFSYIVYKQGDYPQIQSIIEAVKGTYDVREIYLEEGAEEYFDTAMFERCLGQQTPDAVFITGLDNFAPPVSEDLAWLMMKRINLKREWFWKNLPCPLIICIPDSLYQLAHRAANDIM
ncbi:hypothetical protein OAA99_02845, partial [Omnitrophica bacterium]|nr:hypothetical protein [Candidatus Omnitrophota bacterium]